jgi:serine/threonine-protein kinase
MLGVGHVFAGKYRLDRAIASGGMGSVWVARHLQLDTDIAIKLMAPSFASTSDGRARFEREAKASALLKSPHIVQVHDYGVDGDTAYIAMELLEGEDLQSRLDRVTRLPMRSLLPILLQVCKALRRAHDAGLVHRDLKPANIFLARHDDEEVVKVLDFGVAKLIRGERASESTQTGVLVGSPHYMSPEQARTGRLVDHRSDLWSLGVIVFRASTGRLPFDGREIAEVLMQICADPIPVPSEVAPFLGKSLDEFMARALSRDVDARFQSARDLAEALIALSASGGVDIASPSTNPEHAGAAMSAGLEHTEVLQPSSPSEAQMDVAPAQRAGTPGTFAPSGRTLPTHEKRSARRILVGAAFAGAISIPVGIWLTRESPPAPVTATASSAEVAPPPPEVPVPSPAPSVEPIPTSSPSASAKGVSAPSANKTPPGPKPISAKPVATAAPSAAPLAKSSASPAPSAPGIKTDW